MGMSTESTRHLTVVQTLVYYSVITLSPQWHTTSAQENNSAAANTVPDGRSKGASKAKVTKAPKFDKCGTCHNCTHPKLKKGCIWIKQQITSLLDVIDGTISV